MKYITHNSLQSAKGDTSVTVPRPTNGLPGDLLVACLSSDYLAVGTSPGWTEAIRFNRRYDLIGVIAWRIVQRGDKPVDVWSLTGPNIKNGFLGATVIRFRGSVATPIVSAEYNPQRPSKTTMDAPSVEGVRGGCLLCMWIHDDPQLPLAPEGMQQLTRFALHGDGHAVAIETLAKAGPTGIRTATLDPRIGGGGGNMSFSVVIQ